MAKLGSISFKSNTNIDDFKLLLNRTVMLQQELAESIKQIEEFKFVCDVSPVESEKSEL